MVRKIFKISDKQIKEMYLNGSSLSDIAKIAQDTKGLMALRRKLQDLGVDTTKNMKKYSEKLSKAFKKYKLNESVFDTIDTEEKAYWLGFLMSDGYNHETHSQVSLRLQAGDKEILEKYKIFLETDVPIYTFKRLTPEKKIEREYCEVTVSSPHLCKALSKLGCVQAKTYILEFPKLPKNLLQHFIRGYFDGDGCLSIKDRLNRRKVYGKSMVYQFTIVGKKEFLLEIQKILIESIDIPCLNLRDTKGFIKVLHYGGKNIVSKIMNYLYKDATIYLKRKHDLYNKYCNSAE